MQVRAQEEAAGGQSGPACANTGRATCPSGQRGGTPSSTERCSSQGTSSVSPPAEAPILQCPVGVLVAICAHLSLVDVARLGMCNVALSVALESQGVWQAAWSALAPSSGVCIRLQVGGFTPTIITLSMPGVEVQARARACECTHVTNNAHAHPREGERPPAPSSLRALTACVLPRRALPLPLLRPHPHLHPQAQAQAHARCWRNT